MNTGLAELTLGLIPDGRGVVDAVPGSAPVKTTTVVAAAPVKTTTVMSAAPVKTTTVVAAAR